MKKQIYYYEKLRRKFFSKREIVGWGSKNSQEMRFKILEEILKKHNCKTVLDIGCGRGDLISYLKKKKISIKYTGLDINNKFIDIAKKLNPKNNFIFADFLKKDLPNFDVIFISGLFNLKMQHHKKCLLRPIKMFQFLYSLMTNLDSLYVVCSDRLRLHR